MAKYAIDPETGRQIKIKTTHPVRNFVLFPLLGVLVLFVVIGVASSAGKPTPTTATGPAATDAPAPANAGPTQVPFGASHTWRGGETISVSAPKPHTEPNPFLQPPSGQRYVAFDVTVKNGGRSTYQAAQTTITVQHNGRAAQQDFTAGDPLPNVVVPPGGSTTFTQVYAIDTDSGEMQVSVAPNAFAAETLFFVGQI